MIKINRQKFDSLVRALHKHLAGCCAYIYYRLSFGSDSVKVLSFNVRGYAFYQRILHVNR